MIELQVGPQRSQSESSIGRDEVEMPLDHNLVLETNVQGQIGPLVEEEPDPKPLESPSRRGVLSMFVSSRLSSPSNGGHKPEAMDTLDSDDEDAEEDDGTESKYSRETTTNFAVRYYRQHRWFVRAFLAGVILFGIGSYYEYVGEQTISRPMFAAGVACVGFVFADMFLTGSRFTLNLLIGRTTDKKTKYQLMTVLFYLSGLNSGLQYLIWSVFVLSCSVALIPKDENPDWEKIYFYLVRSEAVVFLYWLFYCMTVAYRLQFAKSFNIRTYHEKVAGTFSIEFALCTLLGITMDAYFLSLYNRITKAKLPHPQLWQQVTTYLHRHDVLGTEMNQSHAERWEEELDEHKNAFPKKIAKQLFHRLFAICEVNRQERKRAKVRERSTETLAKLTGDLQFGSMGSMGESGDLNIGSSSQDMDDSLLDIGTTVIQRKKTLTRSNSDTELVARSTRNLLAPEVTLAPIVSQPTPKAKSKYSGFNLFNRKTRMLSETRSIQSDDTQDPTNSNSIGNGSQSYSAASDRRRIHKTDFLAMCDQLYPNTFDPEKFWTALDPLSVGKVSLRRMKLQIISLFEERRYLSTDLYDKNKVIKNLDTFVMSGFLLLLFMIATALFGADFQEIWVAYSGVVLAFVFIFGESLKKSFTNVIFLFVTRPFDVGDMIEFFQGKDKIRFKVARIHLAATTLIGMDGCVTKADNSFLASQNPLFNISTSDPVVSYQRFSVNIECMSEEFLENVRRDLKQFADSKPATYLSFSLNARQLQLNFTCQVSLIIKLTYSDVNRLKTTGDVNAFLLVAMKSLTAHGAKLSVVPDLPK